MQHQNTNIMADLQGKTVCGYTIKSRLGMGGMAEVWYAENKIGKKAAVKLLLSKFCDEEAVASRFLTEAKVMVELDHPNIRQVYDYDNLDGRPAIVMEYLEGDDMKARMKGGQKFTDDELVKWWDQLVDALKYTHEQGIVHRDIKPGNIFIDKKGNVKLLDFGIAKVRESISSTQTGQKIGTLMYMSPEQVLDSKHIDYHTDIYSLAVTFVHLLTGKKPYDSDTSSDYVIQNQIVTKPLDLSDVPVKWRYFLEPYLEKEPKNRPELRPFEVVAQPPQKPAQKPETTIDDEETIVDSAPMKTEYSETSERSKNSEKPKKKSKLGLWLALALALVAVTVVVLLIPKSEKAIKNSEENKVGKAMNDSPVEVALEPTNSEAINDISDDKSIGMGLCEEPLYADRFSLPDGVNGYFDYDQALACAKQQNKPLLVYFTGHVSVDSREREAKVLTDSQVLKILRENYVIAALYVDDKTQLPEDKWVVGSNGKTLKTIGRKNADFQMTKFNTNAQPYYCLINNEGKLLTTPLGYNLDKDEFVKFLNKGLENFKNKTTNDDKKNKKTDTFTNKTFTVEGITFEMIAVKGGTFTMGGTSEQGSDAYDWEKPTHNVILSDYYIGKFEVTQELWYAVMGNNPSYFKGNNLPVEAVSWNDIQEFIKKLNQKTGANFRLPTEAEWEYAARGGNKSRGYKYSGSNNIGDVAWYTDNSGDKTHQVGTKAPNELGIYDMSGNVWEWCQDWYSNYSSSSQTNPKGASSGSARVLRGGSWFSDAWNCRVSFRYYNNPDDGYYFIGFRLVLVP